MRGNMDSRKSADSKRPPLRRRQFLRGAGGFTLGLPLLPSLLTRDALAQAAARPNFIALTTGHGAVSVANMQPPDRTYTQTAPIYGSHQARFGDLKLSVNAGRATVSPVLTGAATILTPGLLSKMNVLRGFDIPFYIGHHSGGHLGNFKRSDQGPQDLTPYGSIDQVMAWSPKFYPNLDGIKRRAIAAGRGQISYGYADPAARTGAVNGIDPDPSSRRLFDQLIAGTQSSGPKPRAPIVDRVLENYRRLRDTDRRISKDDKIRVEGHLTHLGELERRLAPGTARECSNYTRPAQDSEDVAKYPFLGKADGISYFGLMTDVLAMAFACGVTRIATMNVFQTFSDWSGTSWHQDIAHQHTGVTQQQILSAHNQVAFEHTVLSLAAKLDAIPDLPGKTVLDNTLLQWTQESGFMTHDAQDMTIVTFGSAAGYFKTGLAVDFRNRTPGKQFAAFGNPETNTPHIGLLQRQWLATVMHSMGLQTSDFTSGVNTGYGDNRAHPNYTKFAHPDLQKNASLPAPIITMG